MYTYHPHWFSPRFYSFHVNKKCEEHLNKPYVNSKFEDFPELLSRIFNTISRWCGSTVFKPPHRNSTISCPIHGIALIRLVIHIT